LVTIAAINGSVVSGLEWNLTVLSARRANDVEHLARASFVTSVVFCNAAAFRTALGFVLKTFLLIEFLLVCREHKFMSAVFTDQCVVLKIQFKIPLLTNYICYSKKSQAFLGEILLEKQHLRQKYCGDLF